MYFECRCGQTHEIGYKCTLKKGKVLKGSEDSEWLKQVYEDMEKYGNDIDKYMTVKKYKESRG